MIKSIIFICIAIICSQLLFIIPTWFDYGDSDFNWYITDLMRVIRIFILVLGVTLILLSIDKGLWGFLFIVVYVGSNILTVLADYAVINELDAEVLKFRLPFLFVGVVISAYQIKGIVFRRVVNNI